MPNHASKSRWLVAGLLLALAGCSSSPKEELIETTDAKCGEVTGRFTGDLALSGGLGDVQVLEQRRQLLTDLQNHAKDLVAPESGQAELDAWVAALGELSTDLADLGGQLQHAGRGSDMVIAMRYATVRTTAEDAGAAAARFGFTTCADTTRWAELPN